MNPNFKINVGDTRSSNPEVEAKIKIPKVPKSLAGFTKYLQKEQETTDIYAHKYSENLYSSLDTPSILFKTTYNRAFAHYNILNTSINPPRSF